VYKHESSSPPSQCILVLLTFVHFTGAALQATPETVWSIWEATMLKYNSSELGIIGVQHFSLGDGTGSGPLTHTLISRMAADARKRGWRFVTLDECLGAASISAPNGARLSNTELSADPNATTATRASISFSPQSSDRRAVVKRPAVSSGAALRTTTTMPAVTARATAAAVQYFRQRAGAVKPVPQLVT
jgi:hypothetical protein